MRDFLTHTVQMKLYLEEVEEPVCDLLNPHGSDETSNFIFF